MIRLSIQAREALAKLSLPALIAMAFALILAGRADRHLTDRARMALADALEPVYAAFAPVVSSAENAIERPLQLWQLAAENRQLRAENARLRRWQAVGLALAAENASLKAELHWMPDPAVPYVTARAVADAGGLYDRAVLVALAPESSVHVGDVALDADGLVGRVTEIGRRSARVLLITDLNSRIPVFLMESNARAILAGTNASEPKLLYWPPGMMPREGEEVITSGVAGSLPPGLPVGTVRYRGATPMVVPAAHLGRLGIIRLFDYGTHGVPAPAASQPASVGEDQGGHGGG